DGIGAAVGKESAAQIAGGDFGEKLTEPPARFGGERRIDVTKFGGLFLNRLNDMGMAVTKIDVDQLGRPIQIALAVGVVNVDPFGAFNRDWIPRALCNPTRQRMFFILLNRFCRREHDLFSKYSSFVA